MKDETVSSLTLIAVILGFVFTYLSISSDYDYFKWRIDGLERANHTLVKRLNKIPGTALTSEESRNE